MIRLSTLDDPRITQYALSLLRIFVGGALLVRGIYFALNMTELQATTSQNMGFGSFLASHYVVFAHVIGGFCLMIGLLTRLAAVINLPVILGAIIFVHAKEGLFSEGLGLELTIFLLLVLGVISIAGGKYWAVDNLIFRENRGESRSYAATRDFDDEKVDRVA